MKHNGRKQYNGQELSNLGLGQGGWIHVTPIIDDIFYANSSFKEYTVKTFTDNSTNDTWVHSPGHDFENGDKVIISGSTNYDNSGQTLDVALAKTDWFSITTNYVAEVCGTAATATISINNFSAYQADEGSFTLRSEGRIHNFSRTPDGVSPVYTNNEYGTAADGSSTMSALMVTLSQGSSSGQHTFSGSGTSRTMTKTNIGIKGNTESNSFQKGLTVTDFTGGLDSAITVKRAKVDVTANKSSDPNFYYDDIPYFLGIKVLPTVDNTQSTGSAPIINLELTPYDTSLIDQSKADTPGDAIPLKLQGGQTVFGAFKKIKVVGKVNCTLVLYKS